MFKYSENHKKGMRTLNIEKTEKPKRFAKTKQFLACTLLSAGLILGSGCKENVEQYVEKEERIQEQKIDLKIKHSLSKFELNKNNNIEIKLKEGESFIFPKDNISYFDRDKKTTGVSGGDFNIKLKEMNGDGCKIEIERRSVVHTPQMDGKQILNLKGGLRTEEFTLKKGEGHTLKAPPYLTGDFNNKWVHIKYTSSGKFEFSFDDNFDNTSDLSFMGKKLILNGGLYVDGKKVESGTKSRVDTFTAVSESYTEDNGKLILLKQNLHFFETLRFGTDNSLMSKENRKEHLDNWLKRNKYVNLLGHKFEVDYLISDEKLMSNKLDDVYGGVLSLTHVESGQKVYVSRMTPQLEISKKGQSRFRYTDYNSYKTNKYEEKEYSSDIVIGGKMYTFTMNVGESVHDFAEYYVNNEYSITGLSVELKK